MAKTMVHFERCNVGTAEMHNSRNEQYMACVNASPKKYYDIFADETCNNSTWVNPEYAGKSLPQLLDGYRELYRRMVGQAPQEKDRIRQVVNKKTGMTEERTTPGWAPIREGIVPVTAETTAADFRHFAEWLKSKGIEIIRIDIHQDEGHIDPMTGERIYNRHAHIIASWIDPETGRTRKLNKEDASRMQDEIAASLGMERGIKKELTGAEYLTHDQYRAKAQAEEVKKLETRLENDRVSLVESGKQTLECFDALSTLAPGVPKKKEKADRDALEKELQNETPDTTVLATLLSRTIQAISRIGAKLQDLAEDIPLLKKKRLAHESELQAAADAAEKTLQQVEEREAAVADREKNIEKVKQAAIAANDKVWQRKIDELVGLTKQNIRNEHAAGVREGRTAAETEISRLLATVEGKNKEMEQLKASILSKDAKISDLIRNYDIANKLNRQYEARLQKMQQTKSRGIS